MRKTILLLFCVCCFLFQTEAQTCQPTWTIYTSANSGLDGNPVQGIAFDASGKKWITHGNGGVSVLDGSTWTHYTTANSGLPHDNCYGIAPDLSGNMWIGTHLNMAKFDGSTWTVYNSSNSGYPGTQEARRIRVDASNQVWVATQIGLVWFNGTTWTVYDPTNSAIPTYGVMDLVLDASGNKWLVTQGGGVCMFDGSNWTTYNTGNSGLANNEAWGIAIDAAGNKWIGTWGGGLCKFDGSTWTTYNTSNSGLGSNNIRQVAIDQYGKIWCGTNNGVSVFDGTNWTTYTSSNSPLVSNFLFTMAHNDDGSMWMGGFSDNGVSVFLDTCQQACLADTVTVTVNICPADLPYTWNGNTITTTGTGVDTLFLQNSTGCDSLVVLDLLPQAASWTTYTDTNSTLPSGSVAGLAMDHSGNIWATVSNNGVAKFDGNTWTQYTAANSGLPHDNTFGIGVDDNGNVWIGTFAGIVKYDGTNWTVYNNGNSGFPNTQEVRAVKVDAGNTIWAPTQIGLAMFNGSTWTVYDPSNSGITSYGIMDIAFDATGKKWIATQGGGVCILDGSTWATYNTGNSGLANDQVFAVDMDASGNKWFGTWGGGVSKFDGTTWTTYHTGNSGLASDMVREIFIDQTGKIWIGTNAGVSVFDGTSWVTYNNSNSGLASTFLYAILQDTLGSIWMGGFENVNFTGGISVFSDPCQPVCTPSTGTDTHTACGSFTWINGITYTTGNTTATYTLVNAAGCDSVVTLNLTVSPTPDLSVVGNLTACDAADLGNVTITDANATGAAYSWFSDAACTTPVANPGNVTASGTYYVVGTAAACTDTASVGVSIGMAPDLSIPATLQGCDAMDLDTLAINDANNTNATYAWFSDAACSIPVTNNILASGTYYAVGSAGTCSDTVSTNITINNTFTPSVTVETDDLTVCAGTQVTFTAALVDGGMSPSYQWYKNGLPVGGNSGIYSTTSLTSTDEVYVVVSIPEPCAASASLESNHVSVAVVPVSVPQVSITVAPSNIFTPGQQVTFTALASAAGSNPTFTWLKNGAPIAGAPITTTYSTTGLQNGDVISCTVHSNAVCAVPEQAASNSILMVHVSGAGIATNEVPTTVKVFPNPANNLVYIHIVTGENYPNAGIRMIDVAGRVAVTQQQNIAAGEHQFQLETGSLASGIYQLQITADGQIISTQKVMIGR